MMQSVARTLILLSFLWVNGEVFAQVKVPKELEKIPGGYFERSDRPGTLVDFTYRTYESFSYDKKTRPLQKHAVVYLPFGYREDQQYDVFYLMHGGWGDETSTLGTPGRPSAPMRTVETQTVSPWPCA